MIGSAAAVGGIVVAAALVVAGSGGDADEAQAAAVAAAQPVPFVLDASVDGMWVGVRQRYEEDRVLTGGHAVIGGRTDAGLIFWSRRFEGRDPDPFPVAAGSEALILKDVRPDCSAPQDVPVLVVTSRAADGEEHRDSYRPADADAWEETLGAYCRLEPQVRVTGSSQRADGSFSVTLEIRNPTEEAVDVVSEGFTEGSTTWEPASTTVPPRGKGELVVSGEGQGCSATNPWTTGRLTLDGVAPDMDEASSEQC
ncbi:hypothetical protein GCM10009623_06950 [Nocardioides aestuarii]|uniref:Uncharacterized protein n=1 Tax=Nocardioides aestuarii TaxID=252231 RepID=A0ABW4TFT1_9ACTN